MIRKVSHITIAAVLLVLTMGFTVSQHYCGENLVETSVFSPEDVACSDEGSCEMPMSCCHNELHVYQLDGNYTQPVVKDHVPFIQVDLLVFETALSLNNTTEVSEIEIFSDAESPPPIDLTTYLSSIQVYRL